MAGDNTQERESDIISDINVTPLVDVTLVLLIIFMVTATYIVAPAIRVELPEAANAEDNPTSTVALVLTPDGRMFLNGKPTTEDDLRSAVPEELGRKPDLQAIISADQRCYHGQVIHLIDLIKGLGIKRFALNIQKTDSPVPPPSPGNAPGEGAR